MSTLLILVFAAAIFGLLAGVSLTCLALCLPRSESKPVSNGIGNHKPCKQRRESLKRATLTANLLVVGGTIDMPKRRRA